MAMKVSVAEARNNLTKLIRLAEDGQEITICRHGKPIVELSKVSQPARKRLGTLAGKVVVHDPDWWKPMSEREVEDFLDGR
jgi:prevent-host-death family protein